TYLEPTPGQPRVRERLLVKECLRTREHATHDYGQSSADVVEIAPQGGEVPCSPRMIARGDAAKADLVDIDVRRVPARAEHIEVGTKANRRLAHAGGPRQPEHLAAYGCGRAVVRRRRVRPFFPSRRPVADLCQGAGRGLINR